MESDLCPEIVVERFLANMQRLGSVGCFLGGRGGGGGQKPTKLQLMFNTNVERSAAGKLKMLISPGPQTINILKHYLKKLRCDFLFLVNYSKLII